MEFMEEYEYQAINGGLYDVSLKVELRAGEYLVKELTITDALGNVVDEEDEVYDEIVLDVRDREYAVELHETNFDYYDIC